MAISGDILQGQIQAYWSNRFHCPAETLRRLVSVVMPDVELEASGRVFIYHFGPCSLLRLDPQLALNLQLQPGQELASSITCQELQVITRLGMRHSVQVEVLDHGAYHYLDPLDFKPATNTLKPNLLQLNPARDWERIEELCQACDALEVEAAEIDRQNPDAVIFGHELDKALISYAGFQVWEGIFADIGVLTHPRHRKKGMALAASSRICNWCLEHDLIPMYRVSEANLASGRIPIALGFQKIVDIEVLKVTP